MIGPTAIRSHVMRGPGRLTSRRFDVAASGALYRVNAALGTTFHTLVATPPPATHRGAVAMMTNVAGHVTTVLSNDKHVANLTHDTDRLYCVSAHLWATFNIRTTASGTAPDMRYAYQSSPDV